MYRLILSQVFIAVGVPAGEIHPFFFVLLTIVTGRENDGEANILEFIPEQNEILPLTLGGGISFNFLFAPNKGNYKSPQQGVIFYFFSFPTPCNTKVLAVHTHIWFYKAFPLFLSNNLK